MKRRKPKKRRKPFFRRPKQRRPSPELEDAFAEADELIENGRPDEAVELLSPWLAQFGKTADLHYWLGYAYFKAGHLWASTNEYEIALNLSGDEKYWLPLSFIFMELNLKVSALRAFRMVLKYDLSTPDPSFVPETITMLEEEIALVAQMLQRPSGKVEKGLLFMEEGERALQTGNYASCVGLNKKSAKFLGNWPPPWNNMSLALFYDGKPQEAIKIARQVITNYPDNIQALSNIIRYLAWTGREDEAHQYWEQLRGVEPLETSNRLKKAEAAAILGEDESVYELLRPLAKAEVGPELPPGHYKQVQTFLAVAEANLGRFRPARRRLFKVNDNSPCMLLLLEAMRDGRAGPGYADRYPYFRSYELLPRETLVEFMELMEQADVISDKAWQKRIRQFLTRYPQIILFAEKMIWEEDQVDAGLSFLELIDTPDAYAALRRFALSQAGPDHERLHAVNILQQAGQIAPGEEMKLWQNGEWRPVKLATYEINDEPEEAYPEQIIDLLLDGQTAMHSGEFAEAEQHFQDVLSLDPKNKTAYNNLGSVYSLQEKHDQAREMYRAALDIDPLYVFPRVNLAHYLIDADQLEEAKDLLAPLTDKQQFHSQEMAVYAFAQARIAIAEKEYGGARNSLELALRMDPDFESAQNLLDALDRQEMMDGVLSAWTRRAEEMAERDRKKRLGLRAKITTPNPSLAETLPLYTKDQLTAMGHKVIPWGGWSGYRKGELVDLLVSVLSDETFVANVVEQLTDEEREALGFVLVGDGRIPWQQFADKYGDDIDDSFRWKWSEPESTMGRLRLHGLLAEATVDGTPLMVIPVELRPILGKLGIGDRD
ncbi:MAG: tetratricopeptide repeat protein [Chloroflexi bacterium]|nr:tetratricopeptide repeat protein [Chloroflexota bacterium]